MTHRLARLFSPKTIAVIGGGVWCASVVKACRDTGFAGEVWAVHPTRDEVGGAKAYPSIEDLPGAPDAAFIGVNRNAAIEVTRALAANGSGGAVCFASGFREAQAETGDGAELEAALLEAAGSMPLVGPNCYGFLNLMEGAALWPDRHGAERVERGVAIITQSSNIALNMTMQTRGVPLAFLISAGNQAQVSLSEITTAMIEDPRITVIGLHIEGISDRAEFVEMAAAAKAAGKPIVVLKVGASEQAQAAAIAHTASLAGSRAGASALLKRLGMAEVDSPSEMLEALKLLHVTGPLATNEVSSLSCSGGEAALMADLGLKRGISFPPLSEARSDALRAALGPKVAIANPMDYHTYIWGDEAAMAATYRAMAEDNPALTLVVVDFPRTDRCPDDEWSTLVNAVIAARKTTGRPIALVSSLAETMPEFRAKQLMAEGIVPLNGLEDALASIEAAARIGRAPSRFEPPLSPGNPNDPVLVDEAVAKQRLADVGVAVPAQRVAATPDCAAQAAQELGFPVALKGLGSAHKTEAGLVQLALADVDAVREAALNMRADQFLVEEMVSDGVVELLVGVTLDPAHGFVLTIGAGGTLTEILRDTASMIVPAGRDEIDRALDRLKIAPLLDGYRGAPAADREAIHATLAAVQLFATNHAERLVELEINPLICCPDRAVAVDALLRMEEV